MENQLEPHEIVVVEDEINSASAYIEDYSIKGDPRPTDLYLIQCARLQKSEMWALFHRLCKCTRVVVESDQNTISKKIKDNPAVLFHCHRPDLGCPRSGAELQANVCERALSFDENILCIEHF